MAFNQRRRVSGLHCVRVCVGAGFVCAVVAVFWLQSSSSGLSPGVLFGLTRDGNMFSLAGKLVSIDTSLVMMPEYEVHKLVGILERVRTASGGRMAYLEYGSGGSTSEFTKFANVAVSIEHDADWCELVGQRLTKSNIRHVRQLCVPKEVANGTHGGSEGDYVSFQRYLDAVDSFGLPSVYDFVFIDGRARLGAALKVLPYLHDESVVVVHDTARKRYDGVDKYYEVVEKDAVEANYPRLKNGFSILRRRRGMENPGRVLTTEEILLAYASIPDVEA